MMTRRSVLKAIAATACLARHSVPSFGAATAGLGLKDLVAPGVAVGAVIDLWQTRDALWLPEILKNLNLITLGKLKWRFTRPSADAYEFSETDAMVRFCEEHSLAMHGHNLCWNADNPPWLAHTLTRSNGEALLRQHIGTVVGRYAGRVRSWDVVNEPVAAWMGRTDGLYRGPWLDVLGPEYIDIAFHAAADADPKALRVLNVAHVEQRGRGCDQGRACTLKLLEAMLKRGVPVQAVGLESHLAGDYSGLATESRTNFVQEIRRMGVQILITELDVDDTKLPAPPAERDVLVSNCYREYLTSMLAEARPRSIIFFCLSDRKNWYDAAQDTRFVRSDGAPHRPGLLDASLLPKPAYQAAALALKGYRA